MEKPLDYINEFLPILLIFHILEVVSQEEADDINANLTNYNSEEKKSIIILMYSPVGSLVADLVSSLLKKIMYYFRLAVFKVLILFIPASVPTVVTLLSPSAAVLYNNFQLLSFLPQAAYLQRSDQHGDPCRNGRTQHMALRPHLQIYSDNLSEVHDFLHPSCIIVHQHHLCPKQLYQIHPLHPAKYSIQPLSEGQDKKLKSKKILLRAHYEWIIAFSPSLWLDSSPLLAACPGSFHGCLSRGCFTRFPGVAVRFLLVAVSDPYAAPSVPPLAALFDFCVVFLGVVLGCVCCVVTSILQMADPEVDHGFIYNDNDQSVEEYVDRIIFQLASTIEEQISSVQWITVSKVKKAPDGNSLPSLHSSLSGDENFQVGEN
ncbi:hypothetical protein M5K25_001164 [Dendrobium thyrsiflorum]|uniref:Uncharacterized protein n=1 Tax=Dendrobium thyrsiflorum TaxID=117978 RepID=A0ABD0VZ59_DENTH